MKMLYFSGRWIPLPNQRKDGWGNLSSNTGRRISKTLDYYSLNSQNIIYQQDGDPKHTAKLIQKWFVDNNIEVLFWPPQSPNLNLIEHLGNDVDRQIRSLNIEIREKEVLWEQVENIWNDTSLEVCTKLIESMPERVNNVLKARGGYTRW